MGEVHSIQAVNSPECQAAGNREQKNECVKPGRAALSHGGRPVIRPDLGQGHRHREQGEPLNVTEVV